MEEDGIDLPMAAVAVIDKKSSGSSSQQKQEMQLEITPLASTETKPSKMRQKRSKTRVRRGTAKEAYEKNAEALHSAINANDVTTLQRLLAEGADPNTFYGDEFNFNAKTILHLACGKGYTECVRVLLEAGAMPDIQDKWGQMPLHYCLCCQFLDTATALLNHAGSYAATIVNRKLGMRNRTCVYMAAQQGYVDGMKMLIRYGAHLNEGDNAGLTPLMACVMSEDGSRKMMPAMQVLVEAGADLEEKNHLGQTALQVAALMVKVKVVEYLLAAGADVNSVNNSGTTALTHIIKTFNPNSGSESDIMSILVMLTQAGADLDLPILEANALVACIGHHHPVFALPLLRFFLEQGANPDVFVAEGLTPLLLAIRRNDMRSGSVLLEYNCSLKTKGGIYQKDLNPCTVDPIDVALREWNFEFVRYLLLAGDEAWYGGSHSLVLNQLAQAYEDKLIDEELYQWFQHRLSSPLCLCDLTLYKLRSLLGRRICRAVPLLPLPSKLKDAILFTNFFD